MERRDFLKLITAGGVALAVSPLSLVPQTGRVLQGFTCGLFYNGKELNCNGYKRVAINQSCLFNIKAIRSGESSVYLDIPDSFFTLLDEAREVKIDEVRIYRNSDNELMTYYSALPSWWAVFNGTFTVVWNKL